MFGLGPGELLLLAAVVVLVAGPTAIPKLFKGLKTFHEARSKLTPKGIVDSLMREDEEEPKRKKKKKRKA